jgi:hypothetical protein
MSHETDRPDVPHERPDGTPVEQRGTEILNTSSEAEFVDLDDVDFAPILALVEALLPEASRLAAWADEGEIGGWVTDKDTGAPLEDELTGELMRTGALGNTGADMLSRLAEQWLDLESALVEQGLWARPVRGRWEDRRCYAAVCCLRDLADNVFKGCDWLERDLPPDAVDENPYFPLTLAPGSRLGMPHGLFVRRLSVAVELLREVVAGAKSPRRRMTVEEANERAKQLTDTREKRTKFFAVSERKQAERIGCSWKSWSRTEVFKEAVERGWLQKRKNAKKAASDTTGPVPRVVSMTPELEATIAEGVPDEVLKRLVAGESKPRWEDLPPDERRAHLAEHEGDVAANPSPLDPGTRNTIAARTRKP